MRYAAPEMPGRGTFAAWRAAARRAIRHGIAPGDLDWSGAAGLFAASPLPPDDGPERLPPGDGPERLRVPAAFLRLAEQGMWHADPARFGLYYTALWRLARGEGDPLSQSDPLGRRLNLMASAVRRDIHKMHAFVRFRELAPELPPELPPEPAGGPAPRRRFAAWFEPEHDTLEPGSPFFARRFADMDWTIATPRLTAVFRAGRLDFAPGGPRPDLPEDAPAALWTVYFANIFNPARIKTSAMRGEMPLKYWKNLPETRAIPAMLAEAEARVARMQAAGASTPRRGAARIATRTRAGQLALPSPGVRPDPPPETPRGAPE